MLRGFLFNDICVTIVCNCERIFVLYKTKEIMKTQLIAGQIVFSTGLNCEQLIVNVTDKKVTYRAKEGVMYKASKNIMKCHVTSLKIANKFIEDGVWVIK